MFICAYGIESIWAIFYVISSVIGVNAGVTSVSVRMRQKKGFAFTVREGCRELAVGDCSSFRADKVPEKLQVHPCQVVCSLRSIAPDVDWKNRR